MDEPKFLNRIFDLKNLPSYDNRYTNAYDDIHKHTVANFDWEPGWIFTDRRFNLLHCEGDILLSFLALMIHPLTERDAEDVEEIKNIFDKYLARHSIGVYEEKNIGGKPIFVFKERSSEEPDGKVKEIAAEVVLPTEKRIALLIGCKDYEYGVQLKNPINDAKAVKASLENCGFDVMYRENCSLKEMKMSIDDFGIELKKYDVGLFFFAGHGLQVKGLNYLIPVDANLKSEATVEYDCVRVGRILSHMEAADSDVNIIILDACRDNPFERSWGRSVEQRGLVNMDAPKGSLIAYSTSPGKTASDGEGINGLYTEKLITHIASSGKGALWNRLVS